jgi:hypothetical protein
VLHDNKDTVAVVIEGVKKGMTLKGGIMDDDKFTSIKTKRW